MAFWDCAAAAPRLRSDGNPVDDTPAGADAVVVSPRRFVDGPGTLPQSWNPSAAG